MLSVATNASINLQSVEDTATLAHLDNLLRIAKNILASIAPEIGSIAPAMMISADNSPTQKFDVSKSQWLFKERKVRKLVADIRKVKEDVAAALSSVTRYLDHKRKCETVTDVRSVDRCPYFDMTSISLLLQPKEYKPPWPNPPVKPTTIWKPSWNLLRP